MTFLKNLFSGGSERPWWPIPVVAADADHPENQPFRYDHDEPHEARLRQKRPDGFTTKLGYYEYVAGFARPEYRRQSEAFMRGADWRLELVRDPGNRYDPNAVKVMGVWRDRHTGETLRAQIGWIPRERAAKIAGRAAPDAPLAATIDRIFQPTGESWLGLRISIWGPRQPRAVRTPTSAAPSGQEQGGR